MPSIATSNRPGLSWSINVATLAMSSRRCADGVGDATGCKVDADVIIPGPSGSGCVLIVQAWCVEGGVGGACFLAAYLDDVGVDAVGECLLGEAGVFACVGESVCKHSEIATKPLAAPTNPDDHHSHATALTHSLRSFVLPPPPLRSRVAHNKPRPFPGARNPERCNRVRVIREVVEPFFANQRATRFD